MNYLVPKSNSPVEVHCRSGDNDLGNHTLPHVNDEYHWSFCESIVHNTLYFCGIKWGTRFLSFDVYKSSSRDKCYSGVCSYGVMTDGIYFAGSNPIGSMEKIYDW